MVDFPYGHVLVSIQFFDHDEHVEDGCWPPKTATEKLNATLNELANEDFSVAVNQLDEELVAMAA